MHSWSLHHRSLLISSLRELESHRPGNFEEGLRSIASVRWTQPIESHSYKHRSTYLSCLFPSIAYLSLHAYILFPNNFRFIFLFKYNASPSDHSYPVYWDGRLDLTWNLFSQPRLLLHIFNAYCFSSQTSVSFTEKDRQNKNGEVLFLSPLKNFHLPILWILGLHFIYLYFLSGLMSIFFPFSFSHFLLFLLSFLPSSSNVEINLPNLQVSQMTRPRSLLSQTKSSMMAFPMVPMEILQEPISSCCSQLGPEFLLAPWLFD